MKKRIVIKQNVTIYGTFTFEDGRAGEAEYSFEDGHTGFGETEHSFTVTDENVTKIIETMEEAMHKYEFQRCDVEIDGIDSFNVTYKFETKGVATYKPGTYLEPAEMECHYNETFDKLETVLNESISGMIFNVSVSNDYEIEEDEPEYFWINEC